MARTWSRTEKWAGVVIGGIGTVVIAVQGLWVYSSLTAPTLHPNAQDVPAAAQSAPASPWSGAVEQGRRIVRSGLVAQNIPGVEVAVGVGNEIVWSEAFGYANLESKVPLSPDMPLRIGTAAKPFTSAAAGLLAESNKLNLDDEIQRYVPEYPKKQWPVTVRQLMAHVGGVRNDGGDEEDYSTRCERTVDGIRRFADSKLLFEPGSKYRYSNYGWILVSAAIEAAAGEPLDAVLQKRVFGPLGLTHTRIETAKTPVGLSTLHYFPRFAADPRYGPQEPDAQDYSCFSGANGMLSTSSDIVRFVMVVNSGKLLQPATVQAFQTAQQLPSGEDTGYGLGWDILTIKLSGNDRQVIGYDGRMMGGVVSTFLLLRDRGIVISVVANMSYADTRALATGIAQAFIDARR